jgi:hypothetical protein
MQPINLRRARTCGTCKHVNDYVCTKHGHDFSEAAEDEPDFWVAVRYEVNTSVCDDFEDSL